MTEYRGRMVFPSRWKCDGCWAEATHSSREEYSDWVGRHEQHPGQLYPLTKAHEVDVEPVPESS